MREAHLEAASRATGLVGYGTLDFIEPLDLMLADLVHEARLSRRGHLIAPYYIQQILRLRIVAAGAEARNRATLQTTATPGRMLNNGSDNAPDDGLDRGPDERPVFILGLPRTGSTLLHGLLALHPDLRAPTFWESHHFPGTRLHNVVARTLTRLQLFAVDKLAPTFRRIHSLAALAPHECVSIQGHAFRSMQFHVAFRLPTYNRWMMQACDWRPAYEWHQKYLSQIAPVETRWVLKAPGHMLGLAALLSVYPDAIFIQTHRQPREVIPSMASLTRSLRQMASKRHDMEEIGRDVQALWHKGLNDVMRSRSQDETLNARFLDVSYRELVEDQHTVLSRITGHLGIEDNRQWQEKIARFARKNPQGRHGRHHYRAEEFGLSDRGIDHAFEDYRTHYLAA